MFINKYSVASFWHLISKLTKSCHLVLFQTTCILKSLLQTLFVPFSCFVFHPYKIEIPQNAGCHSKRFAVIKKHLESENATADAAFTSLFPSHLPSSSVSFYPELVAFGFWMLVGCITADCSLPVTLTVIFTKSATAARGASHVNVRVTGTEKWQCDRATETEWWWWWCRNGDDNAAKDNDDDVSSCKSTCS